MTQEKIIQLLRSADGFLSGEDLSRKLKISRAGIWKNIEELRKEGYDINAVPHQGYTLKSVPDKLLAREIQNGLTTKYIGQNIVHHDSLSSTMDEAFQLGMDGAPEGSLVCAESQAQGKGRMGRSWVSPKGKGIYMSLLLRPKLITTDVPKLTLLSAVVMSEAIKKVSDIDVSIKWPNDLLIKEKKIAGILTESNAQMDSVKFVVIGIGVNVNAPLNQLPEGATSLKIETGELTSRLELVRMILTLFEEYYEEVQRDGFDRIISIWKEKSSTLGKRICMVEPTGRVEGEAMDLDEYGGLIIKSDKGQIIKRMTGDVLHV